MRFLLPFDVQYFELDIQRQIRKFDPVIHLAYLVNALVNTVHHLKREKKHTYINQNDNCFLCFFFLYTPSVSGSLLPYVIIQAAKRKGLPRCLRARRPGEKKKTNSRVLSMDSTTPQRAAPRAA